MSSKVVEEWGENEVRAGREGIRNELRATSNSLSGPTTDKFISYERDYFVLNYPVLKSKK
jgi:hypothetical protein